MSYEFPPIDWKALEREMRERDQWDRNPLVNITLPVAIMQQMVEKGLAQESDAARYRKWRELALVYKPLWHAFPDAMMAARTPSDIDAAIDAQPVAAAGAQHDQ